MTKAFVVIAALALAGCANFRPAEVDPKTGEFPSFIPLGDPDIKVEKPLAGVKDLRFTFVRTFVSPDLHLEHENFLPFVRDSFAKLGLPKVVTEGEVTRFIIKSGLSGDIQDLRGLLALNRLTRATGPFLYGEFSLVSTPGRYRFEAYLIDPMTGETVLAVSRESVIYVNFDKEFTYPMMNIIKRWYEKSAALPSPQRPALPPPPAI